MEHGPLGGRFRQGSLRKGMAAADSSGMKAEGGSRPAPGIIGDGAGAVEEYHALSLSSSDAIFAAAYAVGPSRAGEEDGTAPVGGAR
eukprot:14001201-Ditylum_brightwellii.AAC.1